LYVYYYTIVRKISVPLFHGGQCWVQLFIILGVNQARYHALNIQIDLHVTSQGKQITRI